MSFPGADSCHSTQLDTHMHTHHTMALQSHHHFPKSEPTGFLELTGSFLLIYYTYYGCHGNQPVFSRTFVLHLSPYQVLWKLAHN